jgi:hypothetical protein
MQNLFGNFRNVHVFCVEHIRNMCRRLGFSYDEHPQSAAPKRKAVEMSEEDHKQAVKNAIEIVNDVKGKKPPKKSRERSPSTLLGILFLPSTGCALFY